MELWHDLRRQHVGGSEVASLYGLGYVSKYTLWHQKKGNIEAANLDDDERVQAGQFLEAGVIQWANKKWNMQFYQPKVYVKHPTVVGMGCTPDAFVAGQQSANPRIIAQVKCVDGLQFAREWEVEDGEIVHAPLHIMLQCQQEMDCCNALENWLIVLVGGNRLYRMIIERDETVCQIIRKDIEAFWKSIEDGVEPTPDYKADGDVIRTLRKRLNVIEDIDLTDDHDLANLLRYLKEAIARRKIAFDEETSKKNKLIHLYGDYERLRCGDMTATIKPDSRGYIRVSIGSEKVTL